MSRLIDIARQLEKHLSTIQEIDTHTARNYAKKFIATEHLKSAILRLEQWHNGGGGRGK